MVRRRVLGDAEQVSFRIGEGGPLDVREFLQDIPLVHGAEPDQAFDLRRPRAPEHCEVPVGHLAFGAGRGLGLEEHPESPGAVGRQVNAVPAGRWFGSSDLRPELGQGGWVRGLQVDGSEGDPVIGHG